MNTTKSTGGLRGVLQTVHDYLSDAGVLNHPAFGELGQAIRNTGLVNGDTNSDVGFDDLVLRRSDASTSPMAASHDLVLKGTATPVPVKAVAIVGNPWSSDPDAFIKANKQLLKNSSVAGVGVSGQTLDDGTSPSLLGSQAKQSGAQANSRVNVSMPLMRDRNSGVKPLATLVGNRKQGPNSNADTSIFLKNDGGVKYLPPSQISMHSDPSPATPSIPPLHYLPNGAVLREKYVSSPQLFNEFFWGDEPKHSVFHQDNDFTKLVQTLPTIQERRQIMINAARHGQKIGGQMNFNYGKNRTRTQRVEQVAKDGLSAITNFDPIMGNPAESFLGSYELYTHPTKIDRVNRTMDVDFYVKNFTGQESFSRNPVNGYNKGAKPLLHNKSTGPRRTTRQDVFWSERLHY